MQLASVTLDDKYSLDKGRIFITGVQALVRLPLVQRRRDLAAGLNTAGFVSGYRGSPLGGYDAALWASKAELEQHHVKFNPGVNEDLAATSVWGTQQVGIFPGETAKYDGVFSIWYGKGPGVDRSGDALKHGNLAGTSKNGGVLVMTGDDHGAKSSTTAHQSEQALVAAMIPVLYPATVQEYLDYGLYGFALSRFSGCWVGMKCVADTVESTATVAVDPDAFQPVTPDDFKAPPGGLHIRWPDGALDQEERQIRFKLQAAVAYHRAHRLDRVSHRSARPRLGIVAAGKAWLDVCQALELLGLDEATRSALGLEVYKLAMTWPLEPEGIAEFCQRHEEILVIEEKRGLIEEQLARILYDLPEAKRPRLVGKRDMDGEVLVREFGELGGAEVAQIIARRLQPMSEEDEGLAAAVAGLEARTEASNKQTAPIARTPWFCSGCPHNTSTRVPDGSRAMAGIGCHTMAIWMNRGTMTFTHMGGEGANWIGQAPFTETRHVFQNLGDGTYFHSGLMALRAASAADVNITYKILYNDAVAMTGGQPVEGNLKPWEISRQVEAEGVKQIVVVSDEPKKYPANVDWAPGVTFRHRDELDQVQRELREVAGVTVLIYDQTCAAEKRRRRKRGLFPDPPKRVFINELVCEGCGDCGVASNCVSVKPLETEFGRKRQIDQSNCNKDFSCLKGFCPSFVTVHGGELRRAARTPAAAAAALADPAAGLPEPAPAAMDGAYNVMVTGIGGTGVVTIGALLGMAAHLEGKAATVLDQTGLAQKNGAVMSHLRIAGSDGEIGGARIGQGQADLILGCDMVVAAGADAMGVMATGRTRAVINDHVVPIAVFAQMPDMPMGGEGFVDLIGQTIGSGAVDFVNATRLATGLMGDSIMSNLFMVGYALQKGYLPVSIAALEQAIELNAVAVEANKRALAWGRRAAVDRASVEAELPEAAEAQPAAAEDLETLVARRVAYLTDYQDAAYAARYRALVDKLAAAERDKAAGKSGLAEAGARYLFKLMAYKDEYEVARLYTSGDFKAKLEAQFAGNYKLGFHLAPPLLAKPDPTTGEAKKIDFGPWMFTAFRLLAKFKGLRGTAFDIFGRTEERKTERQLVADYQALVEEIAGALTPDNHDTAVKLASIPEQIRGFGHVKRRHLDQAKRAEAALLANFRGQPPAAARAAE